MVLVSPPTPPRVELKQLPIPRLFLQLWGRGSSSSFNSGGVAPPLPSALGAWLFLFLQLCVASGSVDVASALLVGWLCTLDAWLLQTWILCTRGVAPQRVAPDHRSVAPALRRRGSCTKKAWLLQRRGVAHALRRRGSFTKEAWVVHSRCVASAERRRGSVTKEAWHLQQGGVAPATRRHGSCTKKAWLLLQGGVAPALRRRGSCTKKAWLLH